MSYARFGCDGDSDVYVYQDVGGGWTCCWCKLGPPRSNVNVETRSEMLEHLLDHRAAGQSVPEHAIERLRAEIETVGNGGRF